MAVSTDLEHSKQLFALRFWRRTICRQLAICNQQFSIINIPQQAGIRFATWSDPKARFYRDLKQQARRVGLALQLPKHGSVETPPMVCRIGVRELQRVGQVGHGGHGSPFLQVGGRLHLEGQPLPGPRTGCVRGDDKQACAVARLFVFRNGLFSYRVATICQPAGRV